MTITATCGHPIPEIDEKYSVTCKERTREGERCLSFEVVCLDCQKLYRKWGQILDTEAVQQAWLHGEDTE